MIPTMALATGERRVQKVRKQRKLTCVLDSDYSVRLDLIRTSLDRPSDTQLTPLALPRPEVERTNT